MRWRTALRDRERGNDQQTHNPVGASLLAIASGQSTSKSAGLPLSRAGSLPQGLCVELQITDDSTNEVTVFSTPGNAEMSFQTLCTRSGLAAPTRSIRSNSPLMTSH
ncbi:hypothetical protein SAMN04490183_5363 [Pseudomonas corrugata]|nr:hypothetical protein SAMN04490183_5363 [Pseudomonas corrugata]